LNYFGGVMNVSSGTADGETATGCAGTRNLSMYSGEFDASDD
jgi:hypothetical protein